LPIATYYTGSHSRLADGSSYYQHSDFCAAGRHIPLGSRLVIENAENGRRIIVTVRDRGGLGRNVIDLPSRSFSRLAGPSWRRKGRIHIRYHIVSKPKKSRHRHR